MHFNKAKMAKLGYIAKTFHKEKKTKWVDGASLLFNTKETKYKIQIQGTSVLPKRPSASWSKYHWQMYNVLMYV